eukprot:CAMPEP_0195595548 /NCGR_PEP_ID=MMETSP0815-20121206/1996_1 /TAXON_ID=97485 /ORGANISM="Prymnesium parvum, Strain Texoma1" /LENGTH=78 /DNA_ID=CAMNT_0040734801 /DNA_START=118 /DNA_END=354 /DNA_ORIENTATION=-
MKKAFAASAIGEDAPLDEPSLMEFKRLEAQLMEAKASSDGIIDLQKELVIAKVNIADLHFQNEEQRFQAKLVRRQSFE